MPGNDLGKRNVFRRRRKTVKLGEVVMWLGRLFQIAAPATGNALGPTVDRRVRETTRSGVDEDRNARRPARAETDVNVDRYVVA